MSFLWKNVSERERERIREEAKRIMDSFSRKLSEVGELKESEIKKERFFREEGDSLPPEIDKKIMFDNAPHVNLNKGVIIAERGKWKK